VSERVLVPDRKFPPKFQRETVACRLLRKSDTVLENVTHELSVPRYTSTNNIINEGKTPATRDLQ
jgi:hypothetical protein